MSKPTVLFSPHFGHLNHEGDWSAHTVGLKAMGLLSLPREWTPAFVVIAAPDFLQNTRVAEGAAPIVTTDFLRDALAPLFNRMPRRLIVRSSASVEQIECRGWLESKVCESTPDDVARVASEVFVHAARTLRSSVGESGAIAFVAQEYKTPRLYGHLSNERRVSHRSNRWLCEIETPTIAGAPKLSWFNMKASHRRSTPKLLLSPDEAALEQALGDLAAWSLNQRVRCHFEWVWDGKRLWVVQRDTETEDRGGMPSSSTVPVLFDIGDPKLRLNEENGLWIDAYRTETLDPLYQMSERVKMRSVA